MILNKKINALFNCIGMLILTFLLTSCSTLFMPVNELSGYYAISPDDKQIVFSYIVNNTSNIYISDINGEKVRKIMTPQDFSCFAPQFSNNGEEILFLAGPINKNIQPYSNIFTIKPDGSNLKQVTSGMDQIVEAVWGKDDKTIYFIKSGYYGNYSPIAQAKFHEFDIFSINRDGSEKKQVTNISAYRMGNLTFSSQGDSLYFYVYGGGYEDDICKIDLSDQNMNIDYVQQGHSPAIRMNEQDLAFTIKFDYQLFIKNFKEEKEKQITNFKETVSRPRFYHTENRIMFLLEKSNKYYLNSIKLDGTDFKKIELDIGAHTK